MGARKQEISQIFCDFIPFCFFCSNFACLPTVLYYDSDYPFSLAWSKFLAIRFYLFLYRRSRSSMWFAFKVSRCNSDAWFSAFVARLTMWPITTFSTTILWAKIVFQQIRCALSPNLDLLMAALSTPLHEFSIKMPS